MLVNSKSTQSRLTNLRLSQCTHFNREQQNFITQWPKWMQKHETNNELETGHETEPNT